MLVTRKGQSGATAPPCEHDDRTGNSIDNDGRTHDNAEPELTKSLGIDNVANEKQKCKNSASSAPEDPQACKEQGLQVDLKRRDSHGGHSTEDTITDSNAPAQIIRSNKPDNVLLAGSACECENSYAGHTLASSLVNLQCIKEYRKSGVDQDSMAHFEFECLMPDGKWYWFSESDVQRYVPPAVGTFWGCGPENWVAPGTGGKETGREVWKRPLANDEDGVPEEVLILSSRRLPGGQTEFLTQKVGYPATHPTWHDVDTIKKTCSTDLERYHLNCDDLPEITDRQAPQLVAIVGHRLNGLKGSHKRIEFSCQWTDDTETWEPEDEVQRTYNAAVLTYWQSDQKARGSCKVPSQRLRILGHRESRFELLLEIQMVGRPSCDSCAVCEELPCRRASKCKPNVIVEPIGRLLSEWPDMIHGYLEDQHLWGHKSDYRTARRSKRLRYHK